MRIGNKQNSALNGVWAGHVDKWMKRQTAKKRRIRGKNDIKRIRIQGDVHGETPYGEVG